MADILGLHPRTIRRFMREGRLKATKLGKQWRIQREHLDSLIGAQAEVGGQSDRIHVSAVADIRVASEEDAYRITNSMLAVTTGKGPEYGDVRYESLYLKEEGKARLMFWGDAAFIGTALITMKKIVQSL